MVGVGGVGAQEALSQPVHGEVVVGEFGQAVAAKQAPMPLS